MVPTQMVRAHFMHFLFVCVCVSSTSASAVEILPIVWLPVQAGCGAVSSYTLSSYTTGCDDGESQHFILQAVLAVYAIRVHVRPDSEHRSTHASMLHMLVDN